MNSRGIQRGGDADLMAPRLSKKHLSLSANRETLAELLQEESQPQQDPHNQVRNLFQKMQKIIIIPSSSLTPSSKPLLSKQHHGQRQPQNQRQAATGEQQQLHNSSAISSRRTLQESASDFSSDAATMVTNQSVEVEVDDYDAEVPSSSAPPPVVVSRKQKSRKSFLRKSLRHIVGESKASGDGKSSPTSNISIISKKKKEEHRLPDPGVFSNNHVLVNRERALRGLTKLNRSRFLDSMAHSHAVDLAEDENLVHSVDLLADLQRQLGSSEVGENVQRGPNIRQMHDSAMNRGTTSRGNILRPAYVEFGMATALGKDGKLYMVQLFRGLPKDGQEAGQLERH
jgi:hypothetical protein